MNNDTAPYAALDPACIFDALDSVGARSDGRLLALNSYENRVYQVGMEEGPPLVAKFYRPQRWTDDAIFEEHRFVQALADAEIPAVPPLVFGDSSLHCFAGFRFAVFPRAGGRAPELDQPGVLAWLGRFIGRIHAIGALSPFSHRPQIDVASFGLEPSAYLLNNGFVPMELEPSYRSTVEQAIAGVQRCFDRAGNVSTLRLHGDCHLGNVLWTEQGPHFVDFDDSRTGPAMQDLWMLLSGSREEMERQLEELLAGYRCFHDFNEAELYLLEALRTLRLIHYSAWLARRWHDPAFPAAFPWFNTQHYWQDRILELREQIALMDEPPLRCS